MLRFILLLFVLIFSVWLGIQLEKDPGVAIFIWHKTSIEMPLWFAGILLFLSVSLLWQTNKILKFFPNSLHKLFIWRKHRQTQNNLAKLWQGLINIIEQDWYKASKQFSKIKSKSTKLTAIKTFAEAIIQHKIGNPEKRNKLLASINQNRAKNLLQAKFALDENNSQQAINLLNSYKNLPAAQVYLHKAYNELKQWKSALQTLVILQKNKIISEKIYKSSSTNAAINWLQEAKTLNELNATWQQIPSDIRKIPTILQKFIQQLIKHSSPPNKTIEHINLYFKHHKFDPQLAYLFGTIITNKPELQLKTAEKWLAKNPNDTNLLLTLAKLSIHCKLWGKARSFANQILSTNKYHLEALAVMGKIEQLTNNPQQSSIYYSKCIDAWIP